VPGWWRPTLGKVGKEAAPANAAKLLGTLGKDARAAIPALIEALSDEDHSVRSNAADMLGGMGADATLNPLLYCGGPSAFWRGKVQRNPKLHADARASEKLSSQ